jgi:hypothetical protein
MVSTARGCVVLFGSDQNRNDLWNVSGVVRMSAGTAVLNAYDGLFPHGNAWEAYGWANHCPVASPM